MEPAAGWNARFRDWLASLQIFRVKLFDLWVKLFGITSAPQFIVVHRLAE